MQELSHELGGCPGASHPVGGDHQVVRAGDSACGRSGAARENDLGFGHIQLAAVEHA